MATNADRSSLWRGPTVIFPAPSPTTFTLAPTRSPALRNCWAARPTRVGRCRCSRLRRSITGRLSRITWALRPGRSGSDHAGLDHLTWDPISSPQDVNQPFAVTVVARDAHESIVSNFTGTVELLGAPGGISPSVSAAFAGGMWQGNVTVAQPASGESLTADHGAGHTAASSLFDVLLTNDLAISISASTNPAPVGAPLTYILTVMNTGADMASGQSRRSSAAAARHCQFRYRLAREIPAGTSYRGAHRQPRRHPRRHERHHRHRTDPQHIR